MHKLLVEDFKNNYKLIISSVVIIILFNYLIKDNTISQLVTFYLAIEIILEVELKSIRDRSLVYFNMFPHIRGYILIEKIVFGIILTLLFYLLQILINYFLDIRTLKFYILLHSFNIIISSGILSLSVPVHILRVSSNFIAITYGIILYINYRSMNNYSIYTELITTFIILILLCFILGYKMTKSDYFYKKS